MSEDEIAPIELSDDELDEVAGGFDIRLNAGFSRFNSVTISQEHNPGSTCGSSRSTFATESSEGAVFQLSITDATAEDVEAIKGLFGDIVAIEGTP